MNSLTQRDSLARWIPIALLVVLIPLGGLSLLRGMDKADEVLCDFEQFYVSGQLAQQGLDPYRTFVEQRQMLLDEYAHPAVSDIVCLESLPERPNYNTPLLVLLMIPFTWLDFQTARMVWFGLQALMAIALPLVMLRLNWRQPGAVWSAIAVLLFLAWAPVRTTFAHGQVALVTSLALMLSIVLVRRDRPLWAGLLLGLALSKYTLTGAVVLYFIVYRHYRALAMAVLAQLAGLILLAPIVGETLFGIIGSYVHLLINVIGQSFQIVSLDGWLNLLGLDARSSALIAFGIGFVLVLALVVPRYIREALGSSEHLPPAVERFKANLLIMIMVLVGVFFVYHRSYDLPIVFLYVTLLMGVPLPEKLNSPTGRAYAVLAAAGLVLTGVMIIPPSAATVFVSGPAADIAAVALPSLALLLVLGASLFALYRLEQLAPLLVQSAEEPPAQVGQGTRLPG